MNASRHFLTALLVGAAVLASALPATAASGVRIAEVVRDGGLATVTGTASFDTIVEPESVGGVNKDFANQSVAQAAGVDMVDAKILPLEDGSGLRFIWQLASMPAQVPPEGVRYTWSFAIGSNQYQLQAKRTNMASITTVEDPVNHVRQLAEQEFFQLRGACSPNYGHPSSPVSGCYHLAFLQGSFDTTAKTVSIDLPYRTRDSIGRLVAADFVPGVTLMESQSAGMSIASAFQAVVGNATTSDFTNEWDTYFVGEQVDLGVGPASANPASVKYTSAADVSGGTFTGTVGGLTGDNTTVFARACQGVATSCTYTQLTP